jgi:hypothetical protein
MLPQITSTAHAKSLSPRCRISNPPAAGVHVVRSASPGDGSNPGYARGVGRPHVWQVVGTAGSGATVAALAANGGVLGRYSDYPASPHLSPVRSKPRPGCGTRGRRARQLRNSGPQSSLILKPRSPLVRAPPCFARAASSSQSLTPSPNMPFTSTQESLGEVRRGQPVWRLCRADFRDYGCRQRTVH